jgi:hypothetical protein
MLCLSYYAYVFSSAKLEIWAEQVLPRSGGGGGEEKRGEEMTQTMHAHVNKLIIIKKEKSAKITSIMIINKEYVFVRARKD